MIDFDLGCDLSPSYPTASRPVAATRDGAPTICCRCEVPQARFPRDGRPSPISCSG